MASDQLFGPREESCLSSSYERKNIQASFCTVPVEGKMQFFSKGGRAQGGDKECSCFHAPIPASGYRPQAARRAQGCTSGTLVPAVFAMFCSYLSSQSITCPLSFREPR